MVLEVRPSLLGFENGTRGPEHVEGCQQGSHTDSAFGIGGSMDRYIKVIPTPTTTAPKKMPDRTLSEDVRIISDLRLPNLFCAKSDFPEIAITDLRAISGRAISLRRTWHRTPHMLQERHRLRIQENPRASRYEYNTMRRISTQTLWYRRSILYDVYDPPFWVAWKPVVLFCRGRRGYRSP